MNILVLDDDYEPRLMWFNNVLGKHNLVLCSNGDEALRWTEGVGFDVIFLDHDLGDDYWDGSRVLNQILMLDEYRKPHAVWAHSENPEGRKNIVAKARSYGLPYMDMGFGTFMGDPEGFRSLLAKLVVGNI